MTIHDGTPAFTKVALVATLAVTAVALAVFALTATAPVDGRTAGSFLLLFSVLFALRVAGQVVVRLRRPGWLPPTEEWNLMPYALLLPIQLVMLALMAWICADLLRGDGTFAEPRPPLGRAVLAFSAIYAGAMLVRYAVRMARRPHARWFGGTIPIVFHLVLASFLVVFGAFHAAG